MKILKVLLNGEYSIRSYVQYVSLCFIDESGMNICIHVDQIAIMKGLQYKLICQLNNQYVKQLLLADTLQYLQKLCKLSASTGPIPIDVDVTCCSLANRRFADVSEPVMNTLSHNRTGAKKGKRTHIPSLDGFPMDND